jgi:hypothetical protein
MIINDGSKGEGHGEIELSEKFLKHALSKRTNIQYTLGQRKINTSLWDTIFEFLKNCKNSNNNQEKIDIPAQNNYVGPISEAFGTPFVIVEGTTTDRKGRYFISQTVEFLKEFYRQIFFDAECTVKKDIDITENDIRKYSLVLVGNASSNLVWGKLERYFPKRQLSLPSTITSDSAIAFAEVLKRPEFPENYIVLYGALNLENLPILKRVNPYKAWFDFCIIENATGIPRQHIFSNMTNKVSK